MKDSKYTEKISKCVEKERVNMLQLPSRNRSADEEICVIINDDGITDMMVQEASERLYCGIIAGVSNSFL